MLTGKRVIIVGGSAGIGLKIAEQLTMAGAKPIIVGRTSEKITMAQKKLTSDTTVYQLDASNEEHVISFFEEIGPFDHLISTIKHPHVSGKFGTSTTAELKQAFDIKFWGQHNLVMHGLKHINPEGSFILTSGIASRRSYPGFSSTAAINGAIESLVKSLSAEIAPLRINAVCPGFIERFSDDKQRLVTVNNLGARLPLERLGSQNETASAYLFLLQNRYATGSIIDIDGGELCS
ncbi:MAG: SDR family oxidoreductase [Psychromonas sp.]|nr:SDR family oxidoreductase [Alteromonadales bacterium]MCP5078776.1 SDR family oxidoreductase [Psychromonas sp.]